VRYAPRAPPPIYAPDNKSGIKLNKLKFVGDRMYTATNQTIPALKSLSFTPSCTQLISLQDIESMSDGEYLSFICQVIDVGSAILHRLIIHQDLFSF
jgi:hypothetical protein